MEIVRIDEMIAVFDGIFNEDGTVTFKSTERLRQMIRAVSTVSALVAFQKVVDKMESEDEQR